MTKRITALLLCVLMIVTMLPVRAVSADGPVIPDCDCGYSGDAGLAAHADGCARKSYLRNTYIVENSAQEIYEDWSMLDPEVREAVLTFLSWSDYNKYTQLSELVAGYVEPSEGETTVTLNGAAVSEVAMPKYDKPTLSATSTLAGEVSFRWQILADAGSGLWVDIHGQNTPELTLSYAMVVSLLDSSNQAWVRCVSSAAEQEIPGEAICVTVLPPVEAVAEVSDEVPGKAATAAPAETPTEAPTEEPTEAPTEAPAEEPTEAPTEAPIEEPAEVPAEEPTEVPTEAPIEEPAEAPAEEPTETPAEVPSEEPAEAPAEAPTEAPVAPAEEPAEVPAEIPTEAPIEAPAAELAAEAPEAAQPTEAEPTAEETVQAAQAVMAAEPETVEDETIEKFILSIVYVYGGDSIHAGTAVAPTWFAEISSLQAYEAVIDSPVIPGYAADQTAVSFNYAAGALTSDVQITVNYSPANVDYTVKHYWQNIDDDNYTEHEIETHQGLTESLVPENLAQASGGGQKYQGLEALPYAIDTIAADGSTLVEIYYDRVYYLMTFELDGGYGTLPIYARYGTAITVPNPTKVGYTFQGWDVDGDGQADMLPATMPGRNTAYSAIWLQDEKAQVTFVFWGENANGESYSYIDSHVLDMEPGTNVTYTQSGVPVCDHHIHGPACSYTCGLEEHTHSDSCYDTTKLVCTKAEHLAHTEACYDCGLTEHTHIDSCYDTTKLICIKEEHLEKDHVDACYACGVVAHNHSDDCCKNGGTGLSHWFHRDSCCKENLTSHDHSSSCGFQCEIHTHSIVDGCYTLSCIKAEHTHDDCDWKDELHTHSIENGCYEQTCGKVEHDHEESGCVYSCGKEEEAHNSSCYTTLQTMDSDLWYYVKADTVMVEADGSTVVNVYYDRTTFTVTFKEEGSNGDTLGTITDKWGASINKRFETISKENTFFWSVKQNGGSPWTSFLDVMPAENRTYYADPQSGSTQITAYYKVQNVERTDYDILYTVSFKGSSGITVSEEEFVEVEGFVFNASKSAEVGDSYNGAEFFYDRKGFVLEFNNGKEIVRTESVWYEKPLAEYNGFIPDAPNIYEADSVEFGGWYLNPECTGERFDLTTQTMPAENMILYAKWKPVVHTVNVYRYKNSDGTFPTEPTDILLDNHPVSHGSFVQDQYIPEKPQDTEYAKFDGWFYIDENGEEQAFDFYNIPVTSDLNIYAKWKSDMLKTVTVRYVTVVAGTDGGEDVEVEIADQETFSAYVGSYKTYEAKTENQLYEGYRTKYYPTTSSSSITVSEDDSKNELTFYYEYMDSVPYRVEYWIENEDGTERSAFRAVSGEPGYEFVGDTVISESEAYVKRVADHGKAVVTEDYIPISSYVPDAMQKRLIVTSQEEKNVIKFVYKYDPNSAFYTVNHYILKPGVTNPGAASDYDLYTNSQIIGTVGNSYSSTPISIPGTTFNETVTDSLKGDNTWNSSKQQMTAVLKNDNSTQLNFYYTRGVYPYQVMYLDAENGSVLLPTKTKDADDNLLSAQYGAIVTESAPAIEGYKVDSATKSLTVQIGNAAQNTITFTYTRLTADLKITKQVQLDEDQLKDDPNLTLPDGAETLPFQFIVSAAEPFHRDSFPYTITRADATTVDGTINVAADSLDKQLEPIALCHGESIVIHGLSLGSYTVTETHVPGYKTIINGTESDHVNLTLDADGEEVTAGAVNSYPFFTGDLLLAKAIRKADETDPDGTGEIFTFAITVTPDAGTLEEDRTIKFKTLDEIGEPVDATFVIPAKGYGQSYTFSLLLKAGQSVTVWDIPAGAFTVLETIDSEHYATEFYKVTYDKQTNENTHATGTSATVNGVIHGGHVAEVTYTNTYKKGDLTIHKTVTEEVSFDTWQGDTFTFTVTGQTELPDGEYVIHIDGSERKAKVENGQVSLYVSPEIAVPWTAETDDAKSWSGSTLIEGLPAGTYTVTETAAGRGLTAYTCDPSSCQVTRKLPENTTAAFENEFKRTTGTLFVSKTIDIVEGSGETIDTTAEFEFTVALPSGVALDKVTGVDQDGNSHVYPVSGGELAFKLKHGQNLTFENLPIGDYTVKEEPASGYASSFPVTGSDGTVQETVNITTGEVEKVVCVNTYPIYVGDLVISKTVTKENSQDTLPDHSFTFVVQLDKTHANKTFAAEGVATEAKADANARITVSLKNGEFIHIKKLPEGACTVTETLPTGSEADYAASYKINTEESVDGKAAAVTIASGKQSTVAFTNQYRRQQTSLTIRRTNVADTEQVFVYEVQMAGSDDIITVTIVGEDTATIHGLPFGTYTVTQKNAWSWRYADEAQTSVTLNSGNRETGAEAVFGDDAVHNQWLDGNSPLIENRRKKGGS